MKIETRGHEDVLRQIFFLQRVLRLLTEVSKLLDLLSLAFPLFDVSNDTHSEDVQSFTKVCKELVIIFVALHLG